MRKLLMAVATVALVGLGTLVPLSSAQAASPNCDAEYADAAEGTFVAFGGSNCYGTKLGSTSSWDTDWGNSSGPFTGGDTNEASSLLNKGPSGVQVFDLAGAEYDGPHACITPGEKYVSVLTDNAFTGGDPVNNDISAHRWVNVNSAQCGNKLT